MKGVIERSCKWESSLFISYLPWIIIEQVKEHKYLCFKTRYRLIALKELDLYLVRDLETRWDLSLETAYFRLATWASHVDLLTIMRRVCIHLQPPVTCPHTELSRPHTKLLIQFDSSRLSRPVWLVVCLVWFPFLGLVWVKYWGEVVVVGWGQDLPSCPLAFYFCSSLLSIFIPRENKE